MGLSNGLFLRKALYFMSTARPACLYFRKNCETKIMLCDDTPVKRSYSFHSNGPPLSLHNSFCLKVQKVKERSIESRLGRNVYFSACPVILPGTLDAMWTKANNKKDKCRRPSLFIPFEKWQIVCPRRGSNREFYDIRSFVMFTWQLFICTSGYR